MLPTVVFGIVKEDLEMRKVWIKFGRKVLLDDKKTKGAINLE